MGDYFEEMFVICQQLDTLLQKPQASSSFHNKVTSFLLRYKEHSEELLSYIVDNHFKENVEVKPTTTTKKKKIIKF